MSNSRHSIPVKEIILYALGALGSLFILGYSVHMLIGGMVEPETERIAIIAACTIGIFVIAFMAWDVVKKRRG